MFLLLACAIDQPFSGPGFAGGELTTKAEGPFHAATTLLDVADDADANAAFNEHMDAMKAALEDQPGLVGTAYSLTLFSNDAYRTLSVWETEEAMLAWVASDVHMAAMSDMADKIDRAVTTTWTLERDEMPPTWDDAVAHLDAEGREAY